MGNRPLRGMAEEIARQSLFRAHRSGRYFAIALRSRHRVLSTSSYCGGERDEILHIVNHQICEGQGHEARLKSIGTIGQEAYHRRVCAELEVDPDRTVLMGTAANMACLTHRWSDFEDLRADAFVTAGVQGNAATAGDSARWHETESGWKPTTPPEATINIALLLNFPLTPSAHARTVVTMTEAKSAVLAELAVPSLYSPSIATGTGTDQYCIASPLDLDRFARDAAGPHVKAGEIIGAAVKEALREALRWQNGLDPSRTRDLFHALGRFGVEEADVMRDLKEQLHEKEYALLDQNRRAVFFDPGVGAAAHALAAVMDRLRFGTIPESSSGEALRQQAACLACSLAAKPQDWPRFYAALGGGWKDTLELVVRALAIGWRAKWA
ncbi:MAG: adenosylcobinamide amidohydrolase [Bryobacterales bacterium]|nr:adenosylcobinamide amidohydrolase [Bryobacterales bacterium]